MRVQRMNLLGDHERGWWWRESFLPCYQKSNARIAEKKSIRRHFSLKSNIVIHLALGLIIEPWEKNQRK
jgi:hypothetical protein|tara:strand:+ start:11161 stop:11367 length:207 start_codon:yes stop_codon:yes gene_type:complete